MTQYDFEFSVIVPVYNVERYLAETLETVVGQSVGFRENIQLVLVNDGSSDGTEAVCLRYQQAHPDNVVYIKQANAGVSAARNNGLNVARGRLVNFLDGDDKWSLTAFEEMRSFLAEHPQVDIAAARIRFFDGLDGFHPMDHKFRGEDLVDIETEPHRIHMHVSSALIRREAIGDRRFDTRLSFAEDFAFVTPIIVDAGCFGALKDTLYEYRRRTANDSLINKSVRTRSWYFETLELCHHQLFEMSRERFGEIVPYIQYAVMYDLQWRLKTPIAPFLSDAERARYRDLVARLLDDIDDSVIMRQRNIFIESKLHALAVKRRMTPAELRRELVVEDKRIMFEGIQIRNLRLQQKLTVDFVEIHGDRLTIEGNANTVVALADLGLFFQAGDERFEARLFLRRDKFKYGFDDLVNEPIGFAVDITLKDDQVIEPVLVMKGVEFRPQMAFTAYSGLSDAMATSYRVIGDWIVTVRKLKKFVVRRNAGLLPRLKREVRYLRELTSEHKRYDLAAYRLAVHVLRPLLSRVRIWMVSDRLTAARDNGEAFFRYLNRTRPRRIRAYYTLAPQSADFARMQRVGRVVAYDSAKYRLLLTLCDKVLSSSADGHAVSAFHEDDIYMRDLYRFRYVFLQHGVIHNDLSSWLNRYNKNIRLFVTSAMAERDSILAGDYYFTDREVKLTGLARHDLLLESKEPLERKIVVMPTWRQPLAGILDLATGERAVSSGFDESDYFRFFNGLINDPRLAEAMRSAGYTMDFAVHPAFTQEASRFKGTDLVNVVSDVDYTHEFVTSRLMVTDYSSVAFDFAFLGKPVVYAQFDRKEFFEYHITQQGYFDYESDGFGPVCDTLERTVDAVIAALRDDCAMQPPYAERAATFFYRSERPYSENVYREVMSIDD